MAEFINQTIDALKPHIGALLWVISCSALKSITSLDVLKMTKFLNRTIDALKTSVWELLWVFSFSALKCINLIVVFKVTEFLNRTIFTSKNTSDNKNDRRDLN